MFYRLLKFACRIFFPLLYKNIHITGERLSSINGPTLIIANHPNSLLDAMIIGTYTNRPIHYIVRSDMFHKPVIRTLLKWLNGIPVYRNSEEKHRIRENRKTFEFCRSVLQQNGVILFFGEGMTVHDWNLKPMRSGLTRLIHTALEDTTLKNRLQIIPVAVNYSKYQSLLKVIHIDCGEALTTWQQKTDENYVAWKKRFNQTMFNSLAGLKYQMRKKSLPAKVWWETLLSNSRQLFNKPHMERNFLHKAGSVVETFEFAAIPPSSLGRYPFFPLNRNALQMAWMKSWLLLLPGVAGLIINGWPYLLLRWFCNRFLKKNIFYDSVLTVATLLLFPAWWTLISLLLLSGNNHTGYWVWPVGIITGYATLHWWISIFTLLNFYRSNTQSRTEIRDIIRLSNK